VNRGKTGGKINLLIFGAALVRKIRGQHRLAMLGAGIICWRQGIGHWKWCSLVVQKSAKKKETNYWVATTDEKKNAIKIALQC